MKRKQKPAMTQAPRESHTTAARTDCYKPGHLKKCQCRFHLEYDGVYPPEAQCVECWTFYVRLLDQSIALEARDRRQLYNSSSDSDMVSFDSRSWENA